MNIKKYPLELEQIHNEYDSTIMSKGHHDFIEFGNQIVEEFRGLPNGEVRHDYFVRAPKKGFRHYYYPCDKDHPKAIPVTILVKTYGVSNDPNQT